MVSEGKSMAQMNHPMWIHSQNATNTRTKRSMQSDVHCAFWLLPPIWHTVSRSLGICSTRSVKKEKWASNRIRSKQTDSTYFWNTWLVDWRDEQPWTQHRTSCSIGKYIGVALLFKSPSGRNELRWKCIEHTSIPGFGTKLITFRRMILHHVSYVDLSVGTLKITRNSLDIFGTAVRQ